MSETKWYEEMAAAMKEREHHINAIDRWEQKLAAVEAKIRELTAAAPKAGGALSDLNTAVESFNTAAAPVATFSTGTGAPVDELTN